MLEPLLTQAWKYDGQVTTDWDRIFARRTRRMKSSAIRELLKLTMQPDVISFAGGMPAPELFPVREVREACTYILETQPHIALQYGPTEGYPHLKELLAEKMQKYGVPAEPANVLLTNGSQQALDMIGRVFLQNGDVVITSEPTYLGAIQAWNPYGPRFVTVPMDEHGMITEKLEEALRQNPKAKFIYVLPNFHNPAGVTESLERRQYIVELAVRYGVFLVEDDPYGELRFEGEDITPLVVMHKENTFYLSTFSKTLAPGLRLGWLVAPEAIMVKFIQAKQGMDLHTSTFVQMIAADIMERGILRQHVKKIRQAYRERRDAMLRALEAYFPEGITWTRPQGGLFLWVQMPEQVDADELLRAAIEERVAFVPGHAFYPDGRGRNTMRLNFSNAQPDRIEEGIRRLGKAVRRLLG